MTRTIFCIKLNEKAEGLSTPPFPGSLGEKIYTQVSKKAWEKWLDQQTILINEYRLSMVDPKARQFLLDEMQTFLFGDKSEKQSDTATND